jgi:hypothetical protein
VVRGDLRLRRIAGFAEIAKAAAQGAALIADGLAGGRSSVLVDTLGIREARGSVLDHLHVIDPAAARAPGNRLSIACGRFDAPPPNRRHGRASR